MRRKALNLRDKLHRGGRGEATLTPPPPATTTTPPAATTTTLNNSLNDEHSKPLLSLPGGRAGALRAAATVPRRATVEASSSCEVWISETSKTQWARARQDPKTLRALRGGSRRCERSCSLRFQRFKQRVYDVCCKYREHLLMLVLHFSFPKLLSGTLLRVVCTSIRRYTYIHGWSRFLATASNARNRMAAANIGITASTTPKLMLPVVGL